MLRNLLEERLKPLIQFVELQSAFSNAHRFRALLHVLQRELDHWAPQWCSINGTATRHARVHAEKRFCSSELLIVSCSQLKQIACPPAYRITRSDWVVCFSEKKFPLSSFLMMHGSFLSDKAAETRIMFGSKLFINLTIANVPSLLPRSF